MGCSAAKPCVSGPPLPQIHCHFVVPLATKTAGQYELPAISAGDKIAVKARGYVTVNFLLENGWRAFYWNPRSYQDVCVRNNHNGKWNEEERGGGWPFSDKSAAQIQQVEFCWMPRAWEISINGIRAESFDFKHRHQDTVVRIRTDCEDGEHGKGGTEICVHFLTASPGAGTAEGKTAPGKPMD
mmetsp:Transcript_30332/g.87061  ORF Transcript_30332/g.87061 Transcript_30332/m.87061 type:complete len:184 (-) Transcript_30332:106-657(-)